MNYNVYDTLKYFHKVWDITTHMTTAHKPITSFKLKAALINFCRLGGTQRAKQADTQTLHIITLLSCDSRHVSKHVTD